MDIFELGSFISVLYAFIIAILITLRAKGARRRFVYMTVLLSLMLLLHSLYHLSAFLGFRTTTSVFEALSALLTLALVLSYVYLWGRL